LARSFSVSASMKAYCFLTVQPSLRARTRTGPKGMSGCFGSSIWFSSNHIGSHMRGCRKVLSHALKVSGLSQDSLNFKLQPVGRVMDNHPRCHRGVVKFSSSRKVDRVVITSHGFKEVAPTGFRIEPSGKIDDPS